MLAKLNVLLIYVQANKNEGPLGAKNKGKSMVTLSTTCFMERTLCQFLKCGQRCAETSSHLRRHLRLKDEDTTILSKRL